MSSSVLFMSVSLDGYVAGKNDGPDNPGGDYFPLHDWGLNSEGTHETSGVAGQMNAEYFQTGAVLSGRRTAEQASYWGGQHHGVPTFVLSRRAPDPQVAATYPAITFLNDSIENAMATAKAAAGDRDVMFHGGAETVRQALEAGVLDEIQLHQVPVLLGGGVRLFDILSAPVELEIARVIDTPQATHLRYRVRR